MELKTGIEMQPKMEKEIKKIGFESEHEDVKNFAKAIPLEKIKNGEWFLSLFQLALKTYREKATAEYFKIKYPGLVPDAIVDRRIHIAKKNAAIEGGSTAFAYSAAIAATIGTQGGSSPLTIPAAFTALAIDLTYTSFLQLRLAYDISVLYNHPLDYDDPEDMNDLLVLAFGIKAGESFQGALQKLAPEATRQTIKRGISGDSLKWLQALPIVGKYLLQRNIIKMAIPVVAVGLGTTLNYYFADKIGKRARTLFRSRVAIEEIANDYNFTDTEYIPLLLSAVWIIIKADGQTKHEEAWYLKYLIQGLQDIDGADIYIQEFSKRINFSEEKLVQEIAVLDKDIRKDIFEAASIAAIVDKKLHKQEEMILRKFAEAFGIEFDKEKLKLAMDFG